MDERVRRALLFIPGDSMRKLVKGAALNADSVILDMEDAVAFNQKAAARQTVLQALTTLDFGRSEKLVRINSAREDDAEAVAMQAADIAETICGRPAGYVLPKVESPVDIQRVAHLITRHESALGMALGSIKLLAMIESAAAIVNLREIAQADRRLVALLLGADDLAADLNVQRTPEGHELLYARSALVAHAAAFGLQAIDTPYVHLRDNDGLRREAEMARRMGYSGKLAIHPDQIETLHATFMPTAEEIEAAEKLLAAFNEHQANGVGAFAYQGRMVDAPVLRSARRILARAQAL